MSSAELQLKLDVINKITELKEIRVIREIKKLLDFELDENVFVLSKQQENRIAEARKKYANGEISTDEEVNNEIEQWLNEK